MNSRFRLLANCALVPLLGLLLVALPADAERKKSNQGGKKNQKKQSSQTTKSSQSNQPAETPPASAAAAPAALTRSDAYLRVDGRLWAWDTERAREMIGASTDETDPGLLEARGRLLAQDKDYPTAIQKLKAAADKASADPEPLIHLGEVYLYAGDEAAANDAFNRAVQRARPLADSHPQSLDALYWLGVAQQRTHQYDAAVATLERARTLDPNHAMTLYQLGLTRAFQERWQEAVDLLGRAIERNNGIAHAYYYRGLAAGRMDRKDLLVADLDRFLVMAPHAPEAGRARRILQGV